MSADSNVSGRGDVDDLRRLARVGVAAAFLLPTSIARRGPVVCLFRRLTGLPCPYCGLTRSWTATAHGQPLGGFRAHPMGPPAFLVALLVAFLPRVWLDRLRPWAPTVGPIVVAVWLVTWLLRLTRTVSRAAAG